MKDQIWDWNEVVNIAKNKTKMVLHLVSNCVTPSKRELYVEQLKYYVNITERGQCSGIKCDDTCARNQIAQHRFYFAFENSVCRDYITEKIFNRIGKLIVPIVLNRSIYDGILVPGSFIAVDDFESPRELADYLEYLARNNTAYLKYFEWTKHYKKPKPTAQYCHLCKYLHEHWKENNGLNKVIPDIGAWWYDSRQCIQDYALRFLEKSSPLKTRMKSKRN